MQAPPKPVLSVTEQVAQAEAAHKKEDAAAAVSEAPGGWPCRLPAYVPAVGTAACQALLAKCTMSQLCPAPLLPCCACAGLCVWLQGRLSEVEGRIASLEAELAALKGEAGELRQRRTAAAQLHQHRLGQIRSGRAGDAGASPAAVAAAVQGGLGALDSLSASLRGEATSAHAASSSAGSAAAGSGGGAADSAASLSQQVVAGEVPLKLLGAMQQVVELNLAQLHELGGKARFFRERLDKVGGYC